MSDEKGRGGFSVNASFDVLGFWAFLFLLFWMQSGWYRVDCALGIKRACELIALERDYKPK